MRMLAWIAVAFLGGFFFLDRIEREMVYPFDPARVSPAEAGAPALRDVIFDSGGQQLVLWVATPGPGRPVILYFHGNAGGLKDRAGRFNRFVQRGYGVVAMAYRGSSGSTGTPGEKAITYDARRLLERIGDYAGTAPVVIYGESLGTGVAVAALEAGRAQPAAVVLEAPYTSLVDVARHRDPRLEPLLDRMKNRWTTLARAGALRAPLLVLHGDADPLIPIAMGRRVFDAAPSADKTFLRVPGGGHTDLWRSDVLPRLWRFIDGHTGG